MQRLVTPSHLWDVGLVASSARRAGEAVARTWRSSASQPFLLFGLGLSSLLWQPDKSAAMLGSRWTVWIRLGRFSMFMKVSNAQICQKMCDSYVKAFPDWGVLLSFCVGQWSRPVCILHNLNQHAYGCVINIHTCTRHCCCQNLHRFTYFCLWLWSDY